ncbi:MAG TPA: ATP-binding protein, partial [Candidatus Paceibacterota bacterium]|nr:ATP-binding protein [Candidatus Paceibacterota bacterium]
RNCLSFKATGPQVILNLLMLLFYTGGVLLDATIGAMDTIALEDEEEAAAVAVSPLAGGFVWRLALLMAVAAWSWGLQILFDRQRQRQDEQQELALRRQQLEAAGRLAAEIAHQLKNPLSIINNASYTLQRTVKEGKTITQQIRIIREEVEKSDRLITELMGYAQLAEGRVEKLDVKEEIERAVLQVFPPAVEYDVKIHRDYAPGLPLLLVQRNHLSETFVNLLQNTREALDGHGNIWIQTSPSENYSIRISIADDGPGIAPENIERIFAPYFTTREKGTGLGLAIVKHNTEMYGGQITVESELGKGARFVLNFPARTLMKLRK